MLQRPRALDNVQFQDKCPRGWDLDPLSRQVFQRTLARDSAQFLDKCFDVSTLSRSCNSSQSWLEVTAAEQKAHRKTGRCPATFSDLLLASRSSQKVSSQLIVTGSLWASRWYQFQPSRSTVCDTTGNGCNGWCLQPPAARPNAHWNTGGARIASGRTSRTRSPPAASLTESACSSSGPARRGLSAGTSASPLALSQPSWRTIRFKTSPGRKIGICIPSST